MRKSKVKKCIRRKTQKRVWDSAERDHPALSFTPQFAELHSNSFESKLSLLEIAKKSFLSALCAPESKVMAPSDKLNALMAKAEKLATFLVTKHQYFE